MSQYTISLSLTIILWVYTLPSFAQGEQAQQSAVQKILWATQGYKATIGVAFSLDNRLYTYNDSTRYPLMSVSNCT